ncbi:MAG: hypothetical protein LBT59_17795 [Clostridiales bacterium]|nr:hypothetical protein [Clostridiales bacterium]
MIKENLKRYWPLTAISLAGYLIAIIAFGAYPEIISEDHFGILRYALSNAAIDEPMLVAYYLAVIMQIIPAALVVRQEKPRHLLAI